MMELARKSVSYCSRVVERFRLSRISNIELTMHRQYIQAWGTQSHRGVFLGVGEVASPLVGTRDFMVFVPADI